MNSMDVWLVPHLVGETFGFFWWKPRSIKQAIEDLLSLLLGVVAGVLPILHEEPRC